MPKTTELEVETESPQRVDPRERFTKDVSDQEKIPDPGSEEAMKISPDFGEDSYVGHKRLQNKVALITGGDSGIGRAVALAFAREGAHVAISYLEEHEDAETTAALVRKAGRECLTIAGDIQSESHCLRLIDETIKKFGHLDVLVNNAAFQMEHEEVDELTTEEFDRTFRTNVYAMFWLSKAALQKMEPGSSIINTTSIQTYNPNPGLLAYAATKAAIGNFTKAFAKAAIKKGVRVNAVAPGPVWTPLIPATLSEDHVKKFGENTVFGRTAQPVEMSPIYVLLASNEASFMTGEILAATGGSTPL